jgi:phage terminase small subunit
MTPQLREFMNNDEGFQQYCAQYHRWINEQMRQQGMIDAAQKTGEQIGRQTERADMIAVLRELGVSPEVLRQAEAKPDTGKQN